MVYGSDISESWRRLYGISVFAKKISNYGTEDRRNI